VYKTVAYVQIKYHLICLRPNTEIMYPGQ